MREKTYKREIAIFGLLFWVALSFWYFIAHDNPAMVTAYEGAYGVVTNAVWLFATAAFGMDWWSKRKEIVGGDRGIGG